MSRSNDPRKRGMLSTICGRAGHHVYEAVEVLIDPVELPQPEEPAQGSLRGDASADGGSP
jgi:hypothetical protein